MPCAVRTRRLEVLRWLGVLAGLSMAGLACARGPTRPNFVLLSIDTLRADHLGAYGYARDTSPRIDAFAARSVRYANAWAPTPWTLPSHAALLTGRHPIDLGIADLRGAIPDSVATLAEALQGAGYATAAFVDSRPRGFLGGERGFARGFESYLHEPDRGRAAFRDDMAATVDAALDWLDQRDAARPFFLFLHTKSVHAKRVNRWVLDPAAVAETDAPYDKPEPWRRRFLPDGRTRFAWTDPEEPAISGARYLDRLNRRLASGAVGRDDLEAGRVEELRDLYDAGIAYVDAQFQRLLDGLSERGLSDDTVVVLTSDHGESFLEGRLLLHVELRPETLRVPLIVRDPRGPSGAVVEAEVGLLDVAPTLLSRAGLALPAELGGRPLPTEHGAAEPSAPSLSYFRLAEGYFYEGWALREGPWKLLLQRFGDAQEPRAELFDLRADPQERSPVEDEPERLREMRERLEARRTEASAAASRSIDLDLEAREDLRALGYVTE